MASLDELKKKYLPQQSTQPTQVRNEAEPQSAVPAANESEGYLDRLKKKYIPTVDQDYINSFMTDADSFLGSAQSDYESMGVDTYSSIHDTRLQKSNDLRKKSFAIRRYLDDNKDAIGEEQYNSFKDYLDSFDKTAGDIGYQFYNASRYYSGEKKRSDIDNMSSRDLKAHLSDDNAVAYTTSDGKNVTWQNLYDKKVKEESAQALYSTISGKSDFRNALRTAKYYQNPTSGEVDNAVVVFGKRLGGTKKPVNKVSYYESNADMIAFGEANGGGSSIVHSRMGEMTEQEKDIYHYYFGIGAYEEADAYLASLEDDLQARFEAQELENTAAFAKDRPVLGSAISVGTNIASAAETLRDLFDFAAKKDLGRNHAADVTNVIRGSVSDQVDWEIGNWDAFDFLYNTAMSGVDSFVGGAAFGGAGGVALGLSAAAQGVNDALDRGMSDGRAFWNGLTSGVFEGLYESASLGNLKALKEVPANTVKDLAKNIAKSMLVNASEEMLTEISNIAYDSLLNGDFSAYETAVRQYMDAGMSESQARAKARGDFVLRVVEAAASGGLMGAGFGAIGSAAGTANTNDLMKKQYGGAEKELVAEALEINPDNAYAKKVNERLDRGKSATGNQLRKLVYQNETTMKAQDRANIKQAAETRLMELGEVDGVSELAEILSKQAAGQELTRAERRSLESSRYGARVANELSPENIRSGEYTSGWAQGIETNRINVDDYNRMVEAAQTVQEAETPMETQEVTEVQNAAQEPVEAANEAPQATVENTDVVEAAPEVEVDAEEPAVRLEDVSGKYGAQAGAMVHTYTQGQDVAKYDRAYGHAYDMGKSGVALSYVMNSEATAYLTEQQRELAYAAGKAASDSAAREQAEKNAKAANGKTGRKRGAVRGEGVNIADLRKSFNDTQGTAYKVLSTYAEATGIDIVLYKSEANADGDFEGAQGKFKWSEDTIYIDINAGLANIKSVNDLAKYAMLRTFSHEFTHFLEKWNPVRYNEFRRVVFDTLTERGENVHDLIEQKLAQDTEGKMDYDAASREVVAEAMTDILPDTTFVHTLAEKHKSIFQKLLEQLKEFAADLKKYFNSIGHNRDRGANALREQVGEAVKYVDSIVKLFDEVALEAVENYQRTVATDHVEVVTDNAEVIPDKAEIVTDKADSKVETPTEEAAGDAFTVTDNREFGTLEIKFDGKPAEAIREVLKAHKFRWHGKKGIWYGKAERADIVHALREAYQAEDTAKEPEVKKPSDFETAFWNATQEERDEVIDAINENTKLTHMRPTELRGETPTNIEEVRENVNTENADNGRSVLEPDTDGQGAARLLDESQDADVSGAAQERDSLGAAGQREPAPASDGDRPDAGSGDSRSEGSSESGDLRRDELSAEDATSEQLQAVVEEQIEQKSSVKPKGSNFVIGDSLNLPDGEKARFHANVAAIRLIKQLESEGRYATEAEQEVLSKYIGWGGLDKAFGEYRFNRETRRSEMAAKDGWEKEFAELKSLVDEGIITEQEYKDMSASTKNAHYTSIEVIKAMYDGLAGLGFKGGRMLEPSSGVGNFVGAMPASMTEKVNSWTMVELDRVTGLIAKYLYPNADVRIQGFETANIPDNYMDVAIGNVPFGNFGVVDRAYPKRITKAIHNYFFAKSIDKVRPGGIVMFITSSFTMNANDTSVRQYMMERADLLGAIRLPNTAFKGNAGTEVVTDILILKKRESGTEYAGEDFLEADYDSNYGTYTSNYFKNHPEMVLGKPVVKRGMYGSGTLTFEPFTDRGTIDEQIREAFKHIKGEMSYPAQRTPEKTNFAVEKAGKKAKAGGFVVHADGSISQNRNGQLVKIDTDEKTAKRIAGMVGIRDAYKTLANYLQQGVEAKYIKQARTALNKAYDAFVAEYGYLNSPANRKAIDSDPDSYSILSLENFDPKKKTAKKADIFTKDTISANKTITHVESVSEGVIASINLTGGVDVDLIARLTDRTVEDVTGEIIESRVAFKTRGGALVARESYLSGNVRAKLREAEAILPFDKDYAHNVEELRRVIPADIPYNEIYITPGNAFIPNEVYADFIAHMLGGRNRESSYSAPDVEVGRTASGDFKIVVNNKRLKNSHYNTQTWGTARKSFLDLIDAMMGSRSIRVNDTIENADGKKISVLNEAETEAANEKAKAIQKEFEDWVWQDEERRTALARLYNETFNAIVNPKYDGSHLSVNGINADFSLRPHQANAVHRIIASGGNTLLAHRVGAGKTLEMAAAAMKLRELGVVKKPVFVVPKSLVAQWGVEFHSYFPASRLLVADDKSFTPGNRRIFTNKIANGDFDAVIVSYEQFEKIPMSVEYQQRFYEEQIDEIIAAIAEEKAESRDGKGMTVKEMEKKKAQLEKKLKELTSKPKDDDNVNFEMLGIDSLFVDEAHNFKNLEYVSKMSNVAGLGSAKGSQRAFDLYTKIRYLQGLNGGRGIVFATATPVMNSMVELYIMQKYLQPDILDRLGLKSFDAWAKQFGEVVNKWEINPSGTGMRQKQVFANFRNLNELQLLFRSFSDVLTEVPGLKIPKMKGGAVKIVECEPGEFQKNFMLELQKRAENVKNVDPSVDNMLKITSDGRKVSYTQRMIDPSLPYEAGSKIFRAADNVLAEYKASSDIKGTQIVFLDMATPKGTDKSKADAVAEDTTDESYDEESARLYDDMRDYLAKKGIPKKEIAFIHEADSDAKRKQLFEDVNNGKVRVLIGSTGKMGVGMNAQKRIVAIHHLDAPWRPGDVEQRDGRAFRQKNMNEEVSKYVYVTKGSFDSRLWDILDRKQHFINQIMNGEDVGRTAEDTGEVTLSAAEVKALASGNPLIEEQTKLTDEIKKLENLLKAYHSSIRLAKTKLSDDEQNIALHKNRITQIREDIKSRVDTYSEGKFSMTVGGKAYTDKKDAGMALLTEIMAKAGKDAYVTVGKFAGFELKAIRNGAEFAGMIHGKGSYKFNVYVSNTTRMVGHIGEVIDGFENMIKNSEQVIADATSDRAVQQEILAKPFEKQDELNAKRARFNEVMEQLAPKTEQQFGNEDDRVQEQSRAYLGDIDSEYMDAVDSGDMETAQKLVNQRADELKAQFFAATDVPTYRVRRKAPPKKTIKVYKVFTLSDSGKPSALFVSSQYELPVGVWLDAQDTWHFEAKNGKMYVPSTQNPWTDGGKTGGMVEIPNENVRNELIKRGYLPEGSKAKAVTALAYRPGWHAGDLPYFPQGGMKQEGSNYPNIHRYNQVVFECEMIADIDYTEYARSQEKAKNKKGETVNARADLQEMPTDGYYEYATNPLTQSHDLGKWFIGGSIKIGRALTQAECDAILAQNGYLPQEWEGGALDLDALGYDQSATDAKRKLLDPVTYDDDGNVIPLSQRFNVDVEDVRYQQRTDTLTDRDVLALAAREIRVDNLSDGEQDALRIFRERLSRLEQLEEERAEQGRLYKEQQFGAKPDRAAAEATLNRMHVLDSQISKANLDVLDVEDKKVLRAVLQKARRVVEAEERAHGQELLARWRDRRNNAAAIKKYRERLRGDVDELTNWVLHPDNKDIVKRIPDALKNSVIPFLSSINFMSKQALRGKKGNTKADGVFLENMKKLNAALKNNIDINGLYSGYNDLPPNFMDNLQRFIDSTEALVKKNSGEFIINTMTADELQELSKVVRTLKKYIMQVNRFHYNAMYQHVFQAGDNTIETLKEMDAAKGTGKISEFLLWQQIRPAYAFERFGEGGKSIYDGLRRGQAQLAFNTQVIKDFADKTYTAAEVLAWEKELKTFYVGGDKLQIPVSTIMSIYRLSKDPEARYHMEGDGFRVATYTHDGKKISDVGHRFTTGEINQIIRALTPRQIEVADQLQGFMAEQGGKWGNYVSVARFGEELFTNKNYFPINSDGRHLAANTEEHPSAAALYALLNMSFTKSRKEKAKNRIVVYSIFDVFANHMASMAQYNAMALPILDAVKWFHYQQVWIDEEGNKEVIGNVREQMARVYGVPEETRPGKGNAGYAVAFVENIIKAFNGTEAQGIPTDETGLSALRRYNMAQVAFNFRVVVQQPLAITRAGMLVDYRSILRGLKANPATIRKNIEEMREHSGIAAWKALGFYDINISRGLTDVIKHKSTLGDKISDVGMWGAEKADMMTWAAIWSAAKEEIRRKMHLSEEDARYYEEVTKLFEDIIYKTQVVDSVLTKNEYLRSKGAFARLIGSFMSEPTTTASMLIDAYDKYQADMQRGMDRKQAWEENKRRIGRLVYVYSLSAVLLAAVQAVADAWRDDDDYQTFLEKWLEAFGGNMVDELMPLNKLPILSDFYELGKSLLEVFGVDTYGNPPQSVFMQWRDSLIDGAKIIYQKIIGEDTNYTWYGGGYKLLQAAAGLTGLPMAAATRELVAAWNGTVGSFAPSLKVKSYEPSEIANIKYAYEDGYLTAEEATAELLAKGLVDNEDEAYFTIAGWEAGEGYSRYDAIYDAIRNGGNVNEALAELTSHGYTEEEVFSQVKGQIGKWYRDGEISKAQATEMLTKYSHHFGMDSDEITETVNKWSAKVVTGIDYNDIGDEYKAGKITASRAIEMYMRYGGYTRDEAQQKITLIDFVKKHPTLEGISYAAVESYKEHAEGAGITAETFYDVWKYNSETQADVDASGKAISGSKKDKVLSYIHSMRLTAAQKDSLYYAFGWAQSKINEAPWR